MSIAAREGPVVVGMAAAAVARRLVHDLAERRDAELREFRLHEGEPAGEAISRVVTGRIDDAVDRLRGADDDDLGTAIHDARKAFKRGRAAIRLGRQVIGDTAYARENAAFRDAGRSLAPARDAEVVVETLEGLIERYREQLPPHAFAGLRATLAAEAASARERIRRSPALVPGVIADLEAARERVAAWDGAGDEAALTAGFRRIYKRGRRAYRSAEEQPDAETLHELRKRAKDLWHAAQIMRPEAPKRMKKLARRAHKLADALGDDHDLAVLRDAAAERPHTLAPGEPLLLSTIVEERQDELRRDALARGRRLYKRKPGRVVAGLGHG
jgi:CHAD domain-containing protein